MESVQERNTWNGLSVTVLLCAMALTGIVAVGLGISWRFGAISTSLLGLCFVVGTGLVVSLVFYNRTHRMEPREGNI